MYVHNYENSDDADVADSVTLISKLDISDPLHLHPNDTTALAVVSIKLKGTENYQVWSCAMLLALERKNKIDFIDGSCKRSNIDEVLGKQWDRINTLKQNGSSIADYYHKLNALWKQYDAMIELPKCVCNASNGFKKHNQLLKLMQLLMGLDDSYMQIRCSILSRKVLPDVRSVMLPFLVRSLTELLLVVYTRPLRPNNLDNNRQGGSSCMNNNRQGGGSDLVCENCGFNGHTIDRCFKIIGYPVDFGKKKSGQNVSNNNSVGKSSYSGANQHMTYTDKELKNVLDISHLRIKVGHHNGTEVYISKIRNPRLSNGFTLYDVMVIPEYCVTLISVHKLAKENKVIFGPDDNRSNFLKSGFKLKNVLWAKQTREPFPLSDYTYKSLGDLVHLDLWGPYRVTSYEEFRLYSLDKHQFIFSRDVKFFENIFPFKDSEVEKNDFENVFQDVNHINFFDIEYPKIPNDDERVTNDLNKGKSDSSSSFVSGSNINTADFPVDSGNDADSSDDLVATQNEEVATLEENIFSEGNLDQNPSSSHVVQNVRRSSRQSVFPKNYNDFVVESKVKYGLKKYIDAMNQEMDAFLRNGTWEMVQLLEDRKAIGIKWIYKIKFRCLLNIVVSMSWPIFQLDMNNAFLYGDLEEVVYLKPPKGYFPFDNKSDKGIFLALLVYVDDIIITRNNVSEIEKFKVFLKSKFMIKDLGKLKYFLGIEIVDTEKGICLNQRKYVLELLSDYGMLACKPAKTPLPSKLVISNETTKKYLVLDNITDYQKLMGKLIFLTNTRPDISYVVHYLIQFTHSSLKSHLKTTFQILRYLKGCPSLGIRIVKESGMSLTAFSDANCAKSVVTRKSVTGYCVFLNNSLVSWKSKKQKTLSKSSIEVEYRALASVTSEVIWVLKILKDLKI
ncbi:ribonuclease H-like domain-containing protein [Tanacetum coccineum]|uniref:Ribonuclease H-like domain-containing protein n=1 Tax=Tanacetum coccineum TaxID=301880 RepID=A0ABQ5BR27_9ASTR